MDSMTGFGKAELTAKAGRFTVEISSVNNRFLDISPRLPRLFSSLEPRVRKLATSRLGRGKVYLYVGFEESEESPGKYAINETAAGAYLKQLQALKAKFKLNGDIKISDLLLLPDVTKPDRENLDEELIWASLKKAIDRALSQLLAMRRKEGAAMAREMQKRLSGIARKLKMVEKRSVESVKKYRTRLNKRIKEVLDSPLPESVRLEEEVAIMAERADITEECARMHSHLEQYRSTLKQKEPVGKKLNFILQELNRETNTVASKSAEINISSTVILIKEEIEKLRELVQNVE